MGSLARVVALVLATSTYVIATPFVNELLPGKEWPPRDSVKQPSDPIPEEIREPEIIEETTTLKGDDVQTIIEDVIVVEASKEPNKETSDEAVNATLNETEVEAIEPKAANLKKEEPQKVDYTGAQVWKVSTEKSGTKQLLRSLRRKNFIATWAGNGTAMDVLVKPHAVQNVTEILKKENIRYEVIIDNLQKVIDEENPPLDENELELQDRRGHRMNWKQYHRLEDIHGFMDYLAKTYPAIVSVNTIGQSHEGRELKLLRISDGKPSNKAVFIDGGIHAREWISPATVTYLINQFAENFDVESDDIKNIDWYFLPVVNPDGYEHTFIGDRLWRKNRRAGRSCSGVDLNRNFGYRWGGKGTSNNPCSEIYRGPRAFSEPESKAISNFFKSTATNFSAYLTYHSYGQYILYPWGYDNVVPPDYKQLDIVGKEMAGVIQSTSGDKYTVGASSNTLYPAAGGSDDWAKAQGVKYAYTIELADTGRYGFVLPTTYIEPVAKSSLAALRVLAARIGKE